MVFESVFEVPALPRAGAEPVEFWDDGVKVVISPLSESSWSLAAHPFDGREGLLTKAWSTFKLEVHGSWSVLVEDANWRRLIYDKF